MSERGREVIFCSGRGRCRGREEKPVQRGGCSWEWGEETIGMEQQDSEKGRRGMESGEG